MTEEEISYPVINKEICKGCMRCIVGCPQNAILLSQEEVHQYKKIVNDSVAKMIKAKAGGK